MNRTLAVLACGAVTPVGLSAPATHTAIRAGVSAYAASSYFQKTLPPKPHVACLLPLRVHPEEETRKHRLADIAAAGIAQCLAGIDPPHAERIPLILCLGERFREEGRPADDTASGLIPVIEHKLGLRFHPLSREIAEGNAGAVASLALARDLIAKGEAEQCIVGGVDSFINVRDLRRFEATYRLKQEGVSQGFVPGEGAAFVRVGAVGARAAHAAEPERELAHILGIGIAREDAAATVLSDGHPTGNGLGKALQNALQASSIPEASVIFRVSDLNGEHYRGMESMMAMGQAYRTRREDIPIWLPAACVGEMGAASGAMLVVMAALGMATRRAPGPVAMCEASSDQGLRAGCAVCPSDWSIGEPWPA